jgi:hypothetical protein
MSWLVRKTYDYFLSPLGFAGNLQCILTSKWVGNVLAGKIKQIILCNSYFSFDHGQTKAYENE